MRRRMERHSLHLFIATTALWTGLQSRSRHSTRLSVINYLDVQPLKDKTKSIALQRSV
jgi:hypothetical protein